MSDLKNKFSKAGEKAGLTDKYLYFRVQFENCMDEDCEAYAEDLEEVKDFLQAVECELDDPDKTAKVIVTGVGLTKEQFARFKEQQETEQH